MEFQYPSFFDISEYLDLTSTNAFNMTTNIQGSPAELTAETQRLLQYLTALQSVDLPAGSSSARRSTGGRGGRKAAPQRPNVTNENDVAAEDEDTDPTPEGMLAECKPLYQQRDQDGRFQWVAEEPEDVVEAAEGKATAKYAFLVRKKKSYDSRKKYDIDSIIVQSPLLKERLGVVLKDYPGITTSLQRLVFTAPFRPFVHRWPRLLELLDPKETIDETARQHLQLFSDTLYDELKNSIDAKIDLVKNGVITFEYFWTILEPGMLVFGTEDGKERVWQLTSTHTGVDQSRGLRFESINAWGVDQDGEKFGRLNETLSVYEWLGTAKITSLKAFPLDFHPEKKQVVERLVQRGKLFERYFGYHFKYYKGTALTYGRCGMVKMNLESRVIVDCEAHNRFLPNKVSRVAYLEAAKDAAALNGSLEVEDIDEEDEGDSFSDISREDGVPTPNTEDSAKAKPKHRALTEKELLLTVPYVRGYALKAKLWLWLFVDQITDIKFSDNAFETLVLPASQKMLIKACVETQRRYKHTFDDIIAGKGRGMIMLLAGAPGTGKTLTAESVSEHMRVPLYMMSAGDLGLDPSGIEDALNTVMDMVAKWNAVLLLDEADVFLEARSSHDLERNKMVSIFLRVLEYYEGILFLTTNRRNDIDDAFHSRIHLTVKYKALSAESRLYVWRTFLGSQSAIKAKEMEELAGIELNGRQIKNVIKTAQMLARSEWDASGGTACKVEVKHVRTVLDVQNGD